MDELNENERISLFNLRVALIKKDYAEASDEVDRLEKQVNDLSRRINAIEMRLLLMAMP